MDLASSVPLLLLLLLQLLAARTGDAARCPPMSTVELLWSDTVVEVKGRPQPVVVGACGPSRIVCVPETRGQAYIVQGSGSVIPWPLPPSSCAAFSFDGWFATDGKIWRKKKKRRKEWKR